MVMGIADSFGGDPFYTQFSNVPMYYNPAFTGVYTGARIRYTSRSQGPASSPNFNGYLISADIGDRNLPGSGGFGIMFSNDNDGVGFIKNTNLGISFSSRVQFNKFIIGQVGAKASWLQKRVSWDDFASSQQLSEKYGHLYDSGFVVPQTNVLNVPDFGIGGLIQFTNATGCIYGTVGIAADHLFEPDESLLETSKAPLTRKYTGHADMIFSVKCPTGFNAREDDVLKINPGIIFQNQGNRNAIMTGVNLTNYGIYFGVWYKGLFGPVNINAIALSGGYRYVIKDDISIKCTYSYDMQVSGPDHAKRGIHEISIALEFNSLHLFKNSGNQSYRQLSKKNKYNSQLAYSDF